MKGSKTYERPLLTKVRLDVRSSVLATCQTTSNSTPDIPIGCQNPFGTCAVLEGGWKIRRP